MKRKFVYVFFALVLALSLSLVTAVPAAAQANYYVATDGSDDYGDGTETWVDNDSSGDWSEWDTGPWLTIQHAIDSASAGDTIIVGDGTYQESISVTTSDLTLRSVNGRDSTTIENVGNVVSPEAAQCGFLIRGSADNFTLGGAAAQGFTFSGGTSPRLIQLNNAPSGVEISHNTVNTTGTASTGINIGAAGATGLTVSNNIFVADEDSTYQDWPLIGPDTANPVLDVTVTDNEFTGSGTPDKYGAAICLGKVGVSSLEASTFSGNNISAFDRGIIISAGSSDLDVSGNSISNCGKGVLFRPDTHADMEGNTFAGNTYNIYHAAEIMTGGSDFYGNINDAINAASPGETINVYAGTYDENLYIDKSLTLQSEEAAEVTTIDGYVEIGLGWDGEDPFDDETVVIDGFTVEPAEEWVAIWLYEVNNGSSATISDCILKYAASHGIYCGEDTLDNGSTVTITGNEIYGCSEGIWFEFLRGSSQVTITGNDIHDNSHGVGIDEVIGGSTLTVIGNTITYNYNDGIYFFTIRDSTVNIGGETEAEANIISNNGEGDGHGIYFSYSDNGTITIEGNIVSENLGQGIYVEEMVASSLEILNKDIMDNYYSGVYIVHFDEDSTVDIHYNSIVDNAEYGVCYDSPYLIDATCNWWGDVAGPYHSTNPYSSWTEGDSITSDVDYIPWLIQSELAAGWNIWSLPIAPDPDSGAQIYDDLLAADMEAMYYFDSATQNWVADPSEAGPLDAFYIKMPGETRIRYYFDGEATFPGVKAMKVGWNLVGLAQLHDMPVYDALYDAYYGTGVAADLVGYSKVISPSLNGYMWTDLRDNIGYYMYPTKGYWVLMVNDGTLGGFTSTPIVEVESGP